MCTAFTNKPNYAPFNVVANRTSLTAGLSTLPSCGGRPRGTSAAAIAASTAMREHEAALPEWAQWLSQQRTTGPNAVPDYANPEQMNHYARYQTSNWKKPYPGDSKIYAPKQVPGATLRSSGSE